MPNDKKETKKRFGFFKKKSRREVNNASLKTNQQAIIDKDTPFVIQEAYKTTRTNIIFAVSGSAEKSSKLIAFTSANPNEGKSTTCINLGITFAQTGVKVLIIDCDLRNPKSHQYLGVTKTKGLSTILSNQCTFDDAVYHDIRPSMDLLASGSIPPNPAELLSSDAMGQLLNEISGRYDYIFFDTPPTTVVTDAVALSKFIDGIVFVVREGYTNHESLEHAISLLKLAHAKILGFFVNDVDPNNVNYGVYQKGYGRSRNYRYNYHYSYRYGPNPDPDGKKDSPANDSAAG